VKEIVGPTIQGEGAHAGRACVFLRFAGCNLKCSWCDTDFDAEGARKLTAATIVEELVARDRHGSRVVVVTGGEPTLQWNAALADRIRDAGFRAHMETNGTHRLAAPVDWLTVSPKLQFHTQRDQLIAPPHLVASECKLVVDDSVNSSALARLEALYQAEHWFLQPCMDDDYDHHLARTLVLVHRHPRWRLSLQIHKIIGVP